jgi:putative hydrolase of the HAD superfamily
MSEGIEAIIFDLGKVLVDFDHSIAARRISYFCDKKPREIFELFFSSDITTIFEEGKITPQEFFLKVKEMLDLRISYERFIPIWNDIFFLSPKNRAVYSLANNLRAYYKVALISNINILHFDYLKKYFPVFGVFCKVFTSFELGAVKPKPIIYERMLQELKVQPQRAFYTDDRVELVNSAKELGIKGFVFIGVPKLRQDLLDSGVNIN